ncbi:glycoside hydrolase family 71 protein [Phellopilus nigrolimitatus]|nr:glycoside hydrolase family 71 protein [Phellopilus nigrolimitatus]
MRHLSLLGGLLVLFLATCSSSVLAASNNSTDSNQRYVFAHHMVGNTAPYTVADWLDDIELASASGIDAFALNVGSDSWQATQVKNAYAAAQQANSTFKLFISFDMTALPCTASADAAPLRNYITTYANHSAQFKHGGKVFASTFSGEKCTFGQGNVTQGWASQFTGRLTGADAVFFVPSFFVDPATFVTYASVMDGQLNWNSAWPTTVTTSTFNALLQKAGAVAGKLLSVAGAPVITDIGQVSKNITSSLSLDQQYIDALKAAGNKLYMASVSPWFFTHYSPQTLNKNFVYLSDQLYPSRWQSIIAARDQIPMVELVTWNDYGESSYLGPIKGAQPNSQAWVDGFNHTAWLDLTKYFALAYKTGTYPLVLDDAIYLWARPHAKGATAKSDAVGKPANYDILEDALFVVVLATSSANVTLATSSNATTVVAVPAGLSQLSIPLSAGDTVRASLSRANTTVVQLALSNFTFEGSPQTYNFNAFTAMARGGPKGTAAGN